MKWVIVFFVGCLAFLCVASAATGEASHQSCDKDFS